MSFEDPIIAEVRDTREQLQAEAGGFEEYVKRLKMLEINDASRLVSVVAKHDIYPKIPLCAENLTEYSGKQ